MGSLILCHNQKAKHPYEITRVRKRIYTIEELCFYLCNNLYLIDYTIMNEQFCDWVCEELECEELAQELIEVLQKRGSIEQFVLKILNYAKIYSNQEMIHIQNVLERLKTQRDIERQKYKADNLLESGEIESAILVYQSILQSERDESVDEKFYGRIYGCLGAAYGRTLLYEEAANMYEKAYQICEDESMLRAYLYACSRYMPEDEYQVILTKSELYMKEAVFLDEKEHNVRNSVNLYPSAELLEEWKQKYRK